MNPLWLNAGTACWSPQTDSNLFEAKTLTLLKTPKLIHAMGLPPQLALQAVGRIAPHFISSSERRALIVCQGGTLINYSDLYPHFPSHGNYASVTRRIFPLWLLHQLPNMTAAHLAREWNIHGPAHSLSQPALPLEQGWLCAQTLFETDEADELLFVAVNMLSPNSPSTSSAWHFTAAPPALPYADFQVLFAEIENLRRPRTET